MRVYTLTAFTKKGEKLLDETFEANNDNEAKNTANSRLAEEGYNDCTHRCVSSDGKLILFHR